MLVLDEKDVDPRVQEIIGKREVYEFIHIPFPEYGESFPDVPIFLVYQGKGPVMRTNWRNHVVTHHDNMVKNRPHLYKYFIEATGSRAAFLRQASCDPERDPED